MNELYNNELKVQTDLDSIRNNQKRISINENGVEQITIEVLRSAKLINDYLSKILSIIDGTKQYFDCDLGQKYRNEFYDFSKNFPVLIQNIENYAYSLKNAVNRYRDYKTFVVSKILTDSEIVASELQKGKVEI